MDARWRFDVGGIGGDSGQQTDMTSVIFDTDMGNDIDDALALSMLHSLQTRRECELLAVTITKDNAFAAPFVDRVNTFYGRPNIPIGVVRGGKTPGDSPYIRVPVQAKDERGKPLYPGKFRDGQAFPDAVFVLRQTLAARPDSSVMVVQVGFSTNLARLLDSKPDRISPLSGAELARRKVKQLVVMAGAFPTGSPEYNVAEDRESAAKVLETWPTPIVASGFEIGLSILYPASSIERDFGWAKNHPVVDAYRLYMKMPYDRPTWDLTAVLYAVRPEHGYFGVSESGKIGVLSDGKTSFTPEPGGTRRYLTVDDRQRARIREAQIAFASEPVLSGR